MDVKNFDTKPLALEIKKIVKEMNKEAVLVCYGPPPEHATFRLEHNVWTYWKSRFIKRKVFFDDDDRVNSCTLGM